MVPLTTVSKDTNSCGCGLEILTDVWVDAQWSKYALVLCGKANRAKHGTNCVYLLNAKSAISRDRGIYVHRHTHQVITCKIKLLLNSSLLTYKKSWEQLVNQIWSPVIIITTNTLSFTDFWGHLYKTVSHLYLFKSKFKIVMNKNTETHCMRAEHPAYKALC